jgi:hypothetical protein
MNQTCIELVKKAIRSTHNPELGSDEIQALAETEPALAVQLAILSKLDDIQIYIEMRDETWFKNRAS